MDRMGHDREQREYQKMLLGRLEQKVKNQQQLRQKLLQNLQ